MKQEKTAKKLGISVSKLRTMGREELASNGWQKVGRGKGCYYRRIAGDKDVPEDERESTEEAKRRKTIAEADLLELKKGAHEAELKRRGVEEFLDAISEILAALPAAYIKCKLSTEQNYIINDAYKAAIDGVENIRKTMG